MYTDCSIRTMMIVCTEMNGNITVTISISIKKMNFIKDNCIFMRSTTTINKHSDAI